MTYYPVNSMLVGGGGGGSTGAGNSTNYQHLHRRSNATSVTGATGQSGTSGVVVGGGGGIMSAADGRSTMSSAHMQHIHLPTYVPFQSSTASTMVMGTNGSGG